MSGDKTINLKGDSFPARYRILEKPGVGGRAEIYPAENKRLNRRIALKILPESFASDKERLLPFVIEIRLSLDSLGLMQQPGEKDGAFAERNNLYENREFEVLLL